MIVKYFVGSSLLDVGCDPDHFIFLEQKHGYEVSGIEPDSQLVALGNKLYPGVNLNVQCGSVENLIINQPVDNITMIDVLEHIKDDKHALSRLREKLIAKNKTDRIVSCIIVLPHLFMCCDN